MSRRMLAIGVALAGLVAACSSGGTAETVSAGTGPAGPTTTEPRAAPGTVDAPGREDLDALIAGLPEVRSYVASLEYVTDPPVPCSPAALRATLTASLDDETLLVDLLDTDQSPDAIGIGSDTWIRHDLLWSAGPGTPEWVTVSQGDTAAAAFESLTGIFIGYGLADEFDSFAPSAMAAGLLTDASSLAGSEEVDLDGIAATRYDVVPLPILREDPRAADVTEATIPPGATLDDLSADALKLYEQLMAGLDEPGAGPLGGPEFMDEFAGELVNLDEADLELLLAFVTQETSQRTDTPSGDPEPPTGSGSIWIDEAGDVRRIETRLVSENPVQLEGGSIYVISDGAVDYPAINEPIDPSVPNPTSVVSAAELDDPDLVTASC